MRVSGLLFQISRKPILNLKSYCFCSNFKILIACISLKCSPKFVVFNLFLIYFITHFLRTHRWKTTISHVKQHKQLTDLSAYTVQDGSNEESKSLDDLSIIMNIYADKLTKDRNGKKSPKFACRYEVF